MIAGLTEAMSLPVAETSAALAGLLENQWFERKSVRVAPRKLANTLIGMANADGGSVVVGIGDGVAEATSHETDQVNALRQAGHDFCIPPVRAEVAEIPVQTSAGQPDVVLLFEVRSSEHLHVNDRDECYLRVGDETRRLSFHQRQELLYDKGQAQYDGRPVPRTSRADLEDELVESYTETIGGRRPQHDLQARGLLTRDGVPTVGGLLMLSATPQVDLPEAYVRVLRFHGRERGTGTRQQLMLDERLEGPIPVQLERAVAALKTVVPTRRALGPDRVFMDEPLIPEAAWLEGLVNALIHRSYSLGGDHIRIEVFDDRIEIESPGRFPGVSRLDDPRRVARFARNPRIARAMADLGYGQELGEGIHRIYQEMALAGYLEPNYRQTEHSVRLHLGTTPGRAGAELDVTARLVFDAIQTAGSLSTGDLVDSTGLTRPPIIRRLKTLESAGLVEWVGKSPQDPRAYWRVRST